MTFREATESDISSIVQLMADDDLGKNREQFQEPLPKEYLIAFERINADNNQELMVVVDDDHAVIGTFQLTFIQYMSYCGGIRAQIENVMIRKDKRGLGIGKHVFEWAINRAKERKAHVLQLTSDKKRLLAIKFYEDLGFIASHEGMKLHFK